MPSLIPNATSSTPNQTMSEIFSILQTALNVLAMVPATAPEASLAGVLLPILMSALQRLSTQSGRPIDLSLIPTEAPLP